MFLPHLIRRLVSPNRSRREVDLTCYCLAGFITWINESIRDYIGNGPISTVVASYAVVSIHYQLLTKVFYNCLFQ